LPKGGRIVRKSADGALARLTGHSPAGANPLGRTEASLAEHLRLINPDAPPQSGRFVMTETARDMLRSLHLVAGVAGGAMTMIAGAPGTGKSEVMRQFLAETHRAFSFEAVSGEGGIWSAAHGIFRALDLGQPNSRDLPGDRQRIAERLGLGGMLIVDEAQYLVQKNPRGKDNIDALEWLRKVSEEGCCSIVFVGDLALLDAVEKLPQLRRRMLRPIIVRRVTKADVEAVVARAGFNDAVVVDVLFAVARRGGGLGDVATILSHAPLFAGGGKVQPFHIMTAIEDLKLQPKGGK
jgi:DNA transposition AAA+ family ATPase